MVLPAQSIAEQVAALLNSYNRLTVKHSSNSIMTSPIQYFVELMGQKVIGCVGLRPELNMDKVVHLCVDPTIRRTGIGSRLLLTAINNSEKDTIYMHIRDDNVVSRSVAQKVGFTAIAYIPKFNYNILTYCLFRRNDVNRY